MNGKRVREYIQPPIPETGWRPPTEFPNLSASKVIAYDVETWDPSIGDDKGPGWARGVGHIVGHAIGADDGTRWYFPIRHTIEPEYNMDPDQVTRFIAHTLGDERPKVGANLIYDYGWCKQEGIQVRGPQYDVQFAEALLNSEAPNVSLDNLAKKYLNIGKEGDLLYQWLADFYGGKATEKQRENIYRATPRLVGPYAEADADRPMHVMNLQWPLLHQFNMLELFQMECAMIPLLVDMRFQGVEIDIPYVEQLEQQFAAEIKDLDAQIRDLAGFAVSCQNKGDTLKKAFDYFQIPYSFTPTGKPSFTADYLESVQHPLGKLVVARRKKEKLRGTFLQSYLLDSHVNGKVFCQFHPLRGDKNGARSGRFASSTPNLQNIPIRSKEGKRIRKAFIARGTWRKFDYSQIEYRLLAHHALGHGADEIRYKYQNDPRTDYHEATQALVKSLTGLEIQRSKIKNVNFGFIYGMSENKLREMLGLDDATATELFKAYHSAVPFAKETARYYSDFAQAYGYVQTIAGRRSLFEKFVPARFDRDATPLDLKYAIARYGKVSRAFTHKALNRVLQGSAADVMKRAMVRAYQSGVLHQTGLPLLTVHDELDFDDQGVPADAWVELKYILETSSPEINVPVIVDHEEGPNWGDVKEVPLAA